MNLRVMSNNWKFKDELVISFSIEMMTKGIQKTMEQVFFQAPKDSASVENSLNVSMVRDLHVVEVQPLLSTGFPVENLSNLSAGNVTPRDNGTSQALEHQ